MKFLVFPTLSTILHAWNLPAPLQDVLKMVPGVRSPIPQFMLDMDDPWLITNKDWLDKYPDVEITLCSKDSALWREGAQDRTPPEDLYRKIRIDNNKAGINRPGWKNAKDRLNEIKACPAALDGVRHLYIDIYVHSGDSLDNLLWYESETPSPSIAKLFAEVLASMNNLERLDFGVSAAATPVFEKAFADVDLTLPSVKYLVPGKFSHYLVSMCPNLEAVESGGYFHHWSWNTYDAKLNRTEDAWDALIEATKGVSLKEFTLSCGDWSPEKLNLLFESSPKITTLELQGYLKSNIDRHSYYASGNVTEYSEELQPYLTILSRFSQLEDLRLPSSSSLGLGFDGGAWCGNAYDGEGGRAYGRSVTQQDAELTEAAGRIVHKALPTLKRLDIGHHSANMTLGEDGKVELVWRWTGRMEEYTYEAYPA
ncbi:hypothetical protein K491DRAFT_756364 [Lophiostoma macrostomum CBS 122681]|uniref:Uncharacterized protein n=1 Tax=Lophiostoma macrostomum CBS 122681 TaxID=1314788 RepID=A0A6A6TFA2_9PLEO|nr:hypothetical protein K491DRAFT_756364 [Lophiostoma macrostomum CBS 122681]